VAQTADHRRIADPLKRIASVTLDVWAGNAASSAVVRAPAEP